jgi:hypothetical protein
MTNVEHPNATAPDSVEVPRLGALQYELGFPTTETSQRLFDEMDFQRARCRPTCGPIPPCRSRPSG